MADPVETAQISPGSDVAEHSLGARRKVADALSSLYGVKISPKAALPDATKDPVTPQLANHLSRSHTEHDWGDVVAGLQGKPRTEASGGFLKILRDKLRRSSPN